MISDSLMCPVCGKDALVFIDEFTKNKIHVQVKKCNHCRNLVEYKFRILNISVKTKKFKICHYLFTSSDGVTIAPNGETLENCQILGVAIGKTPDEALKSLLAEERWITKSGFNEVSAYRLDSAFISDVRPFSLKNNI